MATSSGSSNGRSTTSSTSNVVAVAIRRSNMGSRQAVRWAVDNLMVIADRFLLIHVMPPITSISNPWNRIPIEEMEDDVLDMYRQDMKLKCEEIFLPFMTLCKTKMETLVLEDENPAIALLRYISESGCTSLVLGSSSSRKLKEHDVPTTVLNFVPDTCNIYVVSRSRVITKLIDLSSNTETRNPTIEHNGFNRIDQHKEISSLHPPSLASEFETVDSLSEVFIHGDPFARAILEDNQRISHQKFGNKNEQVPLFDEYHDFTDSSKDAKQFELQAELEGLQLQLRTTLDMYSRACEDLVNIKKKVQQLSSECVEEARRVRIVTEKEEMWKKSIVEEQAKHLEAKKELEAAKLMLAKEVHERQKAELSAVTKSSERQKIIDDVFSNEKRCRRYTREEIEVATDFFAEHKKIGEGGYGIVYKCTLDHTPVAVKILHPDESDKTKKEEFLREVEILSQLSHPHLVLLLGACPEIGCLVYEYMENGSLEERLFCHRGTQPLPWFIRFRIAYEVACGLTFLHDLEPEPVIHRDLKPGNILLDKNYVSKISDVGLAKFMSFVVPDSLIEYRNSTLAGTLSYMDPEYHRTGIIRPKSDVYAFGIIVLQLLTARYPNGLLMTVENAISTGSFIEILDKSITDWPLPETEELAWIAFKCSELSVKDRPDLKSEVLPVLKRLLNLHNIQLQRSEICAPSYYFCPILQEVMSDPHIASDGFTYEYAAIKACFEKQNVSPVTKLMLPHTVLTPNHTLRSAIQEWKLQNPTP